MSQTIMKDIKGIGIGNISVESLSEENKQKLLRGEKVENVKLEVEFKELVVNE